MKKVLNFVLAMMLGAVLMFVVQTQQMQTAQAAERHPKIRAAIRSLEEAKVDMEHAAHDFGGHRVAAMKACDAAIEQLREALKYDK